MCSYISTGAAVGGSWRDVKGCNSRLTRERIDGVSGAHISAA